MVNLSQGGRVVLDTTRCVGFAAFLMAASTDLLIIRPPRFTARDFRQNLLGTSAFQFSELRGFWHRLTLSRKSHCSDVVG
jgi:hypothetical protein